MSSFADNKQPIKVKHHSIKKTATQPFSTHYSVSFKNNAKALDKPGLLAYTIDFLYRNLYLLGSSVIRKNRRFLRLVKARYANINANVQSVVQGSAQWTFGGFKKLFKNFTAPYMQVKNYYYYQKPIIRKFREQEKVPYNIYISLAGLVLKCVAGSLLSVFNYVAPIAAFMFLMSTVKTGINQPLALNVSYNINGEIVDLGYVKNEKSYMNATADVNGRIVSSDGYEYTAYSPIFTLTEIESEELIVADIDLANNIIKASGSEIEHAYGFYVNDVFYGAVEESSSLLKELDRIKQQSATGKLNEKLKFDKNIKYKEGLFPSSSIVDPQNIVDRISGFETYDEVYTVQQGDSPSLIADKLNVPLSLLMEMNPDLGKDGLFIGDSVYTAKARPFLSVLSVYKDSYEEEIDFQIEETENALYARGFKQVTQEGVPGLQTVTAEFTTFNGIEVSREILDTKVTREPVPQKVTIGVNNPKSIISTPATDMSPSNMPQSSSGFQWPAASGYISCYLGGYPGHTGIDIASRAGTAIYASASGVVVKAVYSGRAYGNHIMIDHGNGYTTLYGHNSELYVSVGDVVSQGQVIAAMGRTGNATGNHVHFEIRFNGRIVNPMDYL